MNEKICRQWYIRRFEKIPTSNDEYFAGWLDSFKKGNPEKLMDRESLRIYAEILELESFQIRRMSEGNQGVGWKNVEVMA